MAEPKDYPGLGPSAAAKLRYVERRATAVFVNHAFHEVRPPALEPRGTADKIGQRSATVGVADLRFDGLAALAQLYVHAHDPQEKFSRWMFTGRIFDDKVVDPRRTASWDAVAGATFGIEGPAAEAEIAALAITLAADLGLKDPEVIVGSVGEPEDVFAYVKGITDVDVWRCAVCQAHPDPLRFLTCSDPTCVALAQATPPIRQSISKSAKDHHDAMLELLATSGFKVKDSPTLGFSGQRFERSVIELRAKAGKDSIVVGRGGRLHSTLVEKLGGTPTAAVGFTLGLESAAACVPDEGESFESACEIFFASQGKEARSFCLRAAAVERARGFRVDVELREVGWAEQLRRAERVRARVVVVVGNLEQKAGEVALRDMQTRETRVIKATDLPGEIKRLLR